MASRVRPDRLERITNLVLVLLDTRRPLTLAEIGGTVGGYPPEPVALRQAFERDKRSLRENNIPVSLFRLEGTGGEVGYRILPEDYYLPELDLTEPEERALGLALPAVRIIGSGPADGVGRLWSAPGPGVPPIAMLPSLPTLGELHRAAQTQALATFGYHGRRRELEPHGLVFHEGAWYVVGRDRTAGDAPGGEVRTFRVDRVEGPVSVGEAGAFDPPAEADLLERVRHVPWRDEAVDRNRVAELIVAGREAHGAVAVVGASAVEVWEENGSVRLRCPVGDEDGFVDFVLGLGESAEVVGPPELRALVVARLRAIAAAGPGRRRRGASRSPSPPSPSHATGALGAGARTPLVSTDGDGGQAGAGDRSGDGAGDRSGDGDGSAGQAQSGGRPTVGDRLCRLLAMLTFLDREGEAGIEELALRFGMSRGAVVSELELAACCGLPPYTPDQLIELIVDSDRVFASRVGELGRQRRFTPAEAFELVLAARAILAVPGADRRGALASALAKLEEVLGEDRLVLDIGRPQHLEELRAAVDAHEQVELEYFSSSRGEPTVRLVDPHRVVALEGRWYLDGFCHRVGAVRRFQVDRVRSVTMTGRPSVVASFERPPATARAAAAAGAGASGADPGQGRAFVPGPDARPVRIEMPAEMSWAVERASEGPVEPAGPGRVVVTVFAGSRNWLENLLLRLGPRAEVLDPPEMQGVAAVAARRLLRLYTE